MKNIVVTAYAVDPTKGSEDGMGWNFSQQLGEQFNVTVYTRKNNVNKANEYNKYENIKYKGYDLPYFLRFWKKGKRFSLLYYFLWQIGLAFHVRGERRNYHLAYNLNFHNDWTPTFLWITNLPYIWGPVGHHPRIPLTFMYEDTNWILEGCKYLVKQYFWRVSLSHKIAIKRASHIFTMHSESFRVISKLSDKVSIETSVASSSMVQYHDRELTTTSTFTLLFVGRLVSLKGVMILLDVMVRLPTNYKLRIIGDGALDSALRDKIEAYNLGDRVIIIPWMERSEVLKEYNKADAFFFPSFEGAGMVVVEAMSMALPVICFNNCGPGEIVGDLGFKVDLGNDKEKILQSFAEQIISLNNKSSEEISLIKERTLRRFNEYYDWNTKGERVRSKISSLL